jgi:hypothetical protein
VLSHLAARSIHCIPYANTGVEVKEACSRNGNRPKFSAPIHHESQKKMNFIPQVSLLPILYALFVSFLLPGVSFKSRDIFTMAKDKTDKQKKRDKNEKKRSETDGVHKHKKEKKRKNSGALAEAMEEELTTQVLEGLESSKTQNLQVNGDTEGDTTAPTQMESRPVGALVPFANPLVEDKVAKKVLKTVKKGKALFLVSA